MGFPVFSSAQTGGTSLMGAARLAIANDARRKESYALLQDAVELYRDLYREGTTIDEWFGKLGDEWNTYDAHRYAAVKVMESRRQQGVVDPLLNFTAMCYFPPF